MLVTGGIEGMGRDADFPAVTKERPCEICGGGVGWCSRDRATGNYAHCQKMSREAVPGWKVLPTRPKSGTTYVRAGCERETSPEAVAEARAESDRVELERTKKDRRAAKFANKLWDEVHGTHDHPRLRAYFASRGINLDHLPGGKLPLAVRFAEHALFRFEPKEGPAVDLTPGPAAYCGAVTARDELVGMQRIYLDPDGDGKRPAALCVPEGVDPELGDNKKTLGPLVGLGAAAVRLGSVGPLEPPDGVVLVACEGVETGLALLASINAMLADRLDNVHAGHRFSVWACVSTSGLKAIELRDERYAAVIIAADMDEWKNERLGRPGIKAAHQAVSNLRVRHGGLSVGWVAPFHEDAPGLVSAPPGKHDALGDVAGKSVDWLDVYRVCGPAAVWYAIERATVGVMGEKRRRDGETQRRSGDSSGGEGGGGDGSGDGDGDGDGLEGDVVWNADAPIKILPSNRVRRARLALARLFTPGADADGSRAAAGERFTLVYHVPTQTWLRYNGLRYAKVTAEVLLAHLTRFFHSYFQWTGPGIKLRNARIRAVETKRAARDKRAKENDGLNDSDDDGEPELTDAELEAAWKVAAAPRRGELVQCNLSSATILDIMNAMHVEVAVHHAMLPVWSDATFDFDGRPVWGTSAWPGVSADNENPRERPLFTAYHNGILDIAALKETTPRVVLLAHSPRFVSPNCLPYDLPADAITRVLKDDPGLVGRGWSLIEQHAPNFAGFIRHAANGDDAWEGELQKAVGLLQAADVKFQKIIHFLGTIGSGKSTMADVLCAMLGEKNVGYMSLKDFTEKFVRATMIDKMMIYVDEAKIGSSTDSVEVAAWVQRISSGVGFQADIKNRDIRESVYSSATMLWTSNEMPRFPDGAAALSRRLLVFPFPDGEEQRKRRGVPNDRNLKAKMLAEVPWIAAWGLVGLVRLYREGEFRQPRDGAEHVEEYKRQASQGYAFFCDCLVEEPNSMVSVAMLNAIYKGHALSRSLGVLGQDALQSQLRTIVPTIKRDRVTDRFGSRRYVYKGIRPRLSVDQDVDDAGNVVAGYKYTPEQIVAPADAYRVAEFEFKWRDKNWGGTDDEKDTGHLGTA